MAVENFAKVMPRVFAHEGGFVNDKNDPGGATKYGITARTLGAWRGIGVATPGQVRALKVTDAVTIYRSQYANAVRFDDLPSGVDYAVLDFAINSGVRRAAETLQRVVGANPDGHLGVETVNATKAMPPDVVVEQVCAARLAFLKKLANWKRYGTGWQRRVDEVRAYSVQLAAETQVAPLTPKETAAEPIKLVSLKATGDPLPVLDPAPPGAADDVPPPIMQTRPGVGAATATSATAGSGTIEVIQNALGPIQDQFAGLAFYLDIAKYALIGVAFAGLGLVIWGLVAKRREGVR